LFTFFDGGNGLIASAQRIWFAKKKKKTDKEFFFSRLMNYLWRPLAIRENAEPLPTILLLKYGRKQGDQIGRIFALANWVLVYFGQYLKITKVAHAFVLRFATFKFTYI
jgi:hypothetical protein